MMYSKGDNNGKPLADAIDMMTRIYEELVKVYIRYKDELSDAIAIEDDKIRESRIECVLFDMVLSMAIKAHHTCYIYVSREGKEEEKHEQ